MADNQEMAYLSYQLATIKLDVALDITIGELVMGPEDVEQLKNCLLSWNLKPGLMI